jgi:structural maintenance of chromosomes protein 6
MESPFRLMDEYDVFLDQVARRLTLDQLQRYAKSKDQLFRQFIIITPHAIDVVTSDRVRIHRMKDPERETASGLHQQTISQ